MKPNGTNKKETQKLQRKTTKIKLIEKEDKDNLMFCLLKEFQKKKQKEKAKKLNSFSL